MADATADDILVELRAGFPPGTEDWLDWSDPDGPGPGLAAEAQLLEIQGTAQVEALRRELSPLTCSLAGLMVWERTLGLQNSTVALSGTEAARRRQVLSRLREYGTPTLSLIRTVLNGFLNYDDVTQIQILESDRAGVRAVNEKTWTGPAPFGPGTTATASWVVWDDPRVSPGGVQVDMNVSCADLLTLEITIRAPDGTAYSQPLPIGVGARAGGPGGTNLRIYEPRFIGHRPIFGVWTMDVTSNTPGDELFSATVLVEGLGMYFDWRGERGQGLGAAMYEWGAVVERVKLGPGADLDGAREAVRRLTYARSLGNIVRLPPINLIAIPDNEDTIPDETIPGL